MQLIHYQSFQQLFRNLVSDALIIRLPCSANIVTNLFTFFCSMRKPIKIHRSAAVCTEHHSGKVILILRANLFRFSSYCFEHLLILRQNLLHLFKIIPCNDGWMCIFCHIPLLFRQVTFVLPSKKSLCTFIVDGISHIGLICQHMPYRGFAPFFISNDFLSLNNFPMPLPWGWNLQQGQPSGNFKNRYAHQYPLENQLYIKGCFRVNLISFCHWIPNISKRSITSDCIAGFFFTLQGSPHLFGNVFRIHGVDHIPNRESQAFHILFARTIKMIGDSNQANT